MSILLYIVQYSFVLISPALHLLLGRAVTLKISQLGKFSESGLDEYSLTEELSRSVIYIFGVLLHIALVFALKLLHLPWFFAVFLPFGLIFLHAKGSQQFIKSCWPKASINFVLWFAVTLGLGATLMEHTNGVQTAWVNNYGDLTFHVGMITSFVFGDNFPPDYHIFPGTSLSYPFFINLWSASYWWMNPTWKSLSFIFAIQWAFLWCAVYHLLNGNRYRLIPWALLFGGGSFYYLGGKSWTFIEMNVPWTVFMSSVWVTQRSALLGVCALLAVVRITFKIQSAVKDGEFQESKYFALMAGLLLGLSVLAHTHMFIVAALFCGGTVLLNFLLVFARTHADSEVDQNFSVLCWLLIASFSSVPFFYFILGKESLVSIMYGWTTGAAQNLPRMGVLSASLLMWARDTWQWISLVILLWIFTWRHSFFAVIATLFLLFNFVSLAEWHWDQLKVFIGLYAITLAFWSTRREESAFYLHWVGCLFLIVPALAELFGLVTNAEIFQVYSPDKIERAAQIREELPNNVIIAGGPDHNSLITLTGRPLFMGYEGTLSSHKLKYDVHKDLMSDLGKLRNCKTRNDPEVPHRICPVYLLWTDDEKRFFKKDLPGEGYEKTNMDFLYRIKDPE